MDEMIPFGSRDEPDPVAKVFATAEVLEMIMRNLDAKCMLNCRMVNQFWDKTASSMLKRKPAWITVDASCDAFTRLYKCVSKSKDFPFPGFKLISPKRRDPTFKGFRFGRLTVNAPKYFSKFGHIHSHLDIDVKLPLDADLIENVLAKLPNVIFLEFHQLSMGEANEELELGQFWMPTLTTLSLVGLCGRGNERVLKAIINAAPSLENINNVCCGLVPIIWEHREKVKLVSSMILEEQMHDSISHRLVATPPTLTALSILRAKRYPVRQSVPAIHSVFFGSQKTLKKLVLKEVCINLDQVPIFEQLTLLAISTHHNQSERDICTMLCRLSNRCFPRLHKIRFDLECKGFTESFNSDLFDVGDQLESVGMLEFKSYFVPGVAEFLARKFPRVRHIRVDYKEPEFRIGQLEASKPTYVWSLKAFPCLSKLEIREFSLAGYETKYTLDQFFTGIPNAICDKLRTVPKFEINPFYTEILRPNGSLVHLKNLKEITVSLMTYRTINDISPEKPVVSMVCVWYALELMPNLRVRFCCHPDKLLVVKRMLEPIKDYVTTRMCTEPGDC